jgi:hypothetical protein
MSRAKGKIIGILRILNKSRQNSGTAERVHYFDILEVNTEANDYIDLIMWQNATVPELPILWHISDEELGRSLGQQQQRFLSPLKIPNYPCHYTHSVERCVKMLTTEAAIPVCVPERRDGFIRSNNCSPEN